MPCLLQHRDIKPSNVLLNDRNFPQLGDTGLAKVLHSEGSRRSTTGTGIPGTPGFIDPLLTKGGTLDWKLADGYAMGMMLLMALTGLPVADIEEECEKLAGTDLAPEIGPVVADPAIAWPDVVAVEVLRIYERLTSGKKRERRPLSEALVTLEAQLGGSGSQRASGSGVQVTPLPQAMAAPRLETTVEEETQGEPPVPPEADSLQALVAGGKMPQANAEKRR